MTDPECAVDMDPDVRTWIQMSGHCRGWKEASLTELLCVVPSLLGSILETSEL